MEPGTQAHQAREAGPIVWQRGAVLQVLVIEANGRTAKAWSTHIPYKKALGFRNHTHLEHLISLLEQWWRVSWGTESAGIASTEKSLWRSLCDQHVVKGFERPKIILKSAVAKEVVESWEENDKAEMFLDIKTNLELGVIIELKVFIKFVLIWKSENFY